MEDGSFVLFFTGFLGNLTQHFFANPIRSLEEMHISSGEGPALLLQPGTEVYMDFWSKFSKEPF